MPDAQITGPFKTIALANDTDLPYYVIPFDKRGTCEGPESRQHLIDHAGEYSDIFLFSHGWNNDWKTATDRYESFYEGYIAMRKSLDIAVRENYRPLMVGIFWPSTALVFEGEKAPSIASGAEGNASAKELEAHVAPNDLDRFKALLYAPELDEAAAFELARILRPLYTSEQDELMSGAPTEAQMVAAWKHGTLSSKSITDTADVGLAGDDDDDTDAADLKAASFIGSLTDLARNAVRITTVWMMKDRAGVVGSTGVMSLLVDLLNASQARVHLIGHSYGAKVLLSALCTPSALPRKIYSLFLLQPAVSHLCFANALPGTGQPGGYRNALDRVERPILSTFSKHDVPLTKIFHLALVRPTDLGELKVAAGNGEPPSRFAALGGYGPRAAPNQLITDIKSAPDAYQFDDKVRLIGLCANRTIDGHGDISNPSTWWTLHNLTR